MANDSEKNLIDKLRSNNTSDVYDALLKIRKYYVRNQCKMKKLQKHSVIQLIIPYLEHPKFCNISLSIIADGCLESSFVNEVIKCNGIKSLMRIMKSLVNDDVQNRACRALGNIAKFDTGLRAVHLLKPISLIVQFLSETCDMKCQQTAVRTLMILGRSLKTRELIIHENGIIHIAKLLHSSNVDVLICSTKALANLTQNCSILCARQLLELNFHEVLVKLYSHSDKLVRNQALVSLKNLSSQEEVRSSLVKVGAVKLFTKVLSTCESHEMSCLAALALCSCLDHIHMWSHNGTDRAVGLKALIVILQSERFQDIHFHVISSLIPLSYESNVTDILLSLDVVPVLINILSVFIEKHKCKLFVPYSYKSNCNRKNYQSFSNQIIYDESEKKAFSSDLHLHSNSHFPLKPEKHETKSSLPQEIREDNSHFFSNIIKTTLHEKSPNAYLSKTLKCDHSPYSFSSKHSDYSSSYSPNRMCSPTKKFSASPEMYYEFDLGSPSTGHTSPVSHTEEHTSHYQTCWSPVVSSDSNSPTPEPYMILDEHDEDMSILSTSSIKCSSSSNTDNLEHINISPVSCNPFTLHEFSSTEQDRKPVQYNSADRAGLLINCKNKDNFGQNSDSTENQGTSKRFKSENVNKNLPSETRTQITETAESKNSEIGVKLLSKQLSDANEKQTIDHYLLLFILQISFHLDKKTNSQIADKTCFSVIMDYLYFIHNPSPKAETILLNLMKNRYCFEKLIVSGFVSEMSDKLASGNYSCAHRSDVKLIYLNLINIGREQAESDFGIGTLSHILVTSEKIGQIHAICAMSKLVTEKSGLYRLLFQAKSLSLLFNFLSDNCDITRKRAVISLCELYQSLTKEQKDDKCCFMGTCYLKTSAKCYYKDAYLNVNFSVNGGAEILANREKLCENSEYFNALLDGHFLETTAKTVSLTDISAENLSTIFHFLHGCGTNNCCPYIKRIPFSVLLELLSDCDRFLLMNIKAFVEDRLCHSLFPSTVPKIYRQSKIHNSPALTKKTLHFVLSMNTQEKGVFENCFNELINFESNLNFLNDVESLLKNLF